MAHQIEVFGYWRSSASWRVRWALEHKGLIYNYLPINLLDGENKSKDFLQKNPSGALPYLRVTEGGKEVIGLSQSMAIFWWLEKSFPQKALFPDEPNELAQVILLCEIINADTARLQVPSTQKRHSDKPEERLKWAQDFVSQGLQSFSDWKKRISPKTQFSFGNSVSAADMFLVPQIYNALRYQVDVEKLFPELYEIYKMCLGTAEGQKSSPEAQVDAQQQA